ncbi:hypothetical protein [Thalassobius sp. Cn5-15]|uniref:hypothetical protein n=1 Tax=Thalassobius sp. Cn5-15 TaxID=2917763 RepID=UPI001EF39520|nr:hypothetical protein [Thalassobius sp. Cn5-15]
MQRGASALVLGICTTLPAIAQAPLSAIDWLNDPVTAPVVDPTHTLEPPVSTGALAPNVSVTTLGASTAEAVGLLSSRVTGLPADLWQHSDAQGLNALLTKQQLTTLPAIQALFYTLLLAEAEAPFAATDKASFLNGRLDALLSLGAVEAVQALLDRAGTTTPDRFARWFDATLLTGDEDRACEALRDAPNLSPSYAARVYCTARRGDWTTAALTLSTGTVLGLITPQERALLDLFLDPELFEGAPLPHPPVRPSPLIFRLQEAVGEPLPTAPLPRAFAVSDLRGTSGWKARIEAAERLAQTGALAPNRLHGIYSERLPAASGGLWDRVDAVQRFDLALKARDPAAIATTLPRAVQAMRVAQLEVAFAKIYAKDLMTVPLTGAAADLAYHTALLSPHYEVAAQQLGADRPQSAFLTALAKGQPASVPTHHPVERKIIEGFNSTALPPLFATEIAERRLGEVILQAMRLYQRAIAGELAELPRALATFRALGLEDTARQAALQFLLLERAGT